MEDNRDEDRLTTDTYSVICSNSARYYLPGGGTVRSVTFLLPSTADVSVGAPCTVTIGAPEAIDLGTVAAIDGCTVTDSDGNSTVLPDGLWKMVAVRVG